ncbi:MAG: ribosomal-processing cysteine protease Prp [Bacillota bacterium]|nr:ribosomal-processing cysteine protease Prp [Bacillota bacterium]
MISIKTQKQDKSYVGVEIFGHSNYDESGKDIICSAVSILSYTLLNSLNSIGKIDEKYIDIEENETEGLLVVKLTKQNKITNLLFENFLVGIKLLMEDYSDYITLKYEEV